MLSLFYSIATLSIHPSIHPFIHQCCSQDRINQDQDTLWYVQDQGVAYDAKKINEYGNNIKEALNRNQIRVWIGCSSVSI